MKKIEGKEKLSLCLQLLIVHVLKSLQFVDNNSGIKYVVLPSQMGEYQAAFVSRSVYLSKHVVK